MSEFAGGHDLSVSSAQCPKCNELRAGPSAYEPGVAAYEPGVDMRLDILAILKRLDRIEWLLTPRSES